MTTEIFITQQGLHQLDDEVVNKKVDFTELSLYLQSGEWTFSDEYIAQLESNHPSIDEQVGYLKKEVYPNLIQGAGSTLAEAKDHWNQLYFLDYDIKTWTAGAKGMKKCIRKLADAFSNHLLIMPSNRFGIHVILCSARQYYNPAEHIYYAIIAHRIIHSFNPVFKDNEMFKQVMDPAFFNNFNQRMNLNLYTYFDGNRYKMTDFAVFNSTPTRYPKQISTFEDYVDILSDNEKQVIDKYRFRLYGGRKKDICTTHTKVLIANNSSNRLNIDHNFCIPGVGHTGNDLRWRIVAILYNQVGYDNAKRIISSAFVQVQEMLSALETIHKSNSGKYQFTNFLIEQFAQRYILEPMNATQPIYLSQEEYLSNHIQTIDSYLRQGSVYLVSSPNTGKTELVKKLIHKFEKCVIVVPQHSILDSKFANDLVLKQYIVRTEDLKHLAPIPDKIICIWDTFEALARHTNFSDYYVMLDEVHNFILQFGFRNVIIKVLEALKDIPHQLWMTGTPCGEEALLGQHVRLDFAKKANTQYNVLPVQLDTNSKNEYIGYIESFIDNEITNNRKVFIYDNYDHYIWNDYMLGKSAHYESIYKDSTDVKEINQTCKSSKNVVVSTCYLGEGVDIKGYKEVDVVIPTNLFISETNIRQFIKRFRDASIVNVYLIQYSKYTDNRMPYKQREIELHQEYVKGLSDTRNERNPKQEETLMIDHLTRKQITMIASDVRYQRLYNAFFMYQSSPFNIYMAHYLSIGVDIVKVDPIKTIPVNVKKAQTPSRINPELLEYVNKNYERLAHWIDETSSYDEVINYVETELNDGEEVPYRKEIRDLLEIISAANNLGCLKDSALYFQNGKGVICWDKVSRFCQHIKMKMELLTKQITLRSNVYECMMDGNKLSVQIDKTCELLKFPVTGKPSFKAQIGKYKDVEMQRLSKSVQCHNLFGTKFISIFKEKPKTNKTSRPKKKPVVIVCIATGETMSFASQKECQEYLGMSKPKFKDFAAGTTKWNKTWKLQ